jgi:hypothetical protein
MRGRSEYLVRCEDGRIRHTGEFSLEAAEEFAEWGHACTVSATHSIEFARPMYSVPGAVTATCDMRTGEVELSFTPHGGGAGYFGPCAVPFYGKGPFDQEQLDDSESPFWRAIQRNLEANQANVKWVE